MPKQKSIEFRRVCELCGLVFFVERTYHKGRFCSQKCHYETKRTRIEDRFWNHIGNKTERGCILWNGKKMPHSPTSYGGYGLIGGSKKKGKRQGDFLAHRLSFELMVGPIPSGLCVLHRCDNPPCINPVHLFLGTRQDNVADCVSKGRNRAGRGEQKHTAKLTVRDVLDIRATPNPDFSALAAKHGITRGSIWNIINRRTWKHI